LWEIPELEVGTGVVRIVDVVDAVVELLVVVSLPPAVPTPSDVAGFVGEIGGGEDWATAEFVDVAVVCALVLDVPELVVETGPLGVLTALVDFLLEWPTEPPTAPPTIAPMMSKAIRAMVSLPLPDRQNETGAPPAR